jgi:hypothetical protein
LSLRKVISAKRIESDDSVILRVSLLLFGHFGVKCSMNAELSSPDTSFIRQPILRQKQYAVQSLARCGLCAALLTFLFIPSGRLAAQQGAVAAGTASSSVAVLDSDPLASSDSQHAQQSAQTGAPSASAPPGTSANDRDPQTRRILGIIPNFRAISTDEKLPAQSVKEKFVTATEDSFDYSSAFIPLTLAGYSQLTNATPEFGTGGVAYGRYLWHAAVDQTSENYMVEFVVPVITHEDTRYYTLGRGGFWKRAGYALSRAVVTRSDSDKEVFNASEVIGAGAAAGLSSLYYPTAERSFGNTGKEWGLDVGIDAASFVAKEFWPDINHWLFHAAKPSVTAPQ